MWERKKKGGENLNMKALLLLAVTFMVAVSIVGSVVIALEASTSTPPEATEKATVTSDLANVRLLGETIGDPTAPGNIVKT
jgi:hypothetical protein